MYTYSLLTAMTIFSAIILTVALATIISMKEEIVLMKGAHPVFIPVFCFLIVATMLSYPFGYFVANPPATTNEVWKLARLCPSIKEMVEARSEILKYREATELYNQCIKNQELSEQVTLEKQKEAVKK